MVDRIKRVRNVAMSVSERLWSTILAAFDFLPHFCSGVSIHMTIHNSRLKGDTMSLMTSQCHFGCFADN